MGFLLGAFGKLAAGRRVRQLQAQMMRVQSRLRRATRDVSEMEKQLQRQEKDALNAVAAQGMAAKQNAMSSLGTLLGGNFDQAQFNTLQQKAAQGQLTSDEASTYNSMSSLYTQGSTTISSYNEQWISQMKQQVSNNFEMMREIQLEPLKDEEEMLQTEKDSLESQIQIAQQDYEACKKMEQADAKNLAPNYTGQG